MNIQNERIRSACDALTLTAVAEHYPLLAENAAKAEASYTDFLEQYYQAEQRRASASIPIGSD